MILELSFSQKLRQVAAAVDSEPPPEPPPLDSARHVRAGLPAAAGARGAGPGCPGAMSDQIYGKSPWISRPFSWKIYMDSLCFLSVENGKKIYGGVLPGNLKIECLKNGFNDRFKSGGYLQIQLINLSEIGFTTHIIR